MQHPDTPSDGRVRVLVVAGVRLYREGLAANLGAREELSVVGSAASGDTARELVASLKPDVIVLDMGLSAALNVVRAIRGDAPTVKIIAFAVEDLDFEVIACAEAGVSGYVPCEASIDDLVEAIKNLTRGEVYCPPRVAASLFQHVASLASVVRHPSGNRSLTRREREVVALIDAGLSNKEIALRLHIEVSTVKNHVHNLLEKVQATSRTQAAARLRQPDGHGFRTKLASAAAE
jgi:two-component system, NarL family, nitrate/nitrite response regulator NarL